MLASSMSTSQISGGARRLWRAQTNPYDAQNLVRASVADPSSLRPQAVLSAHFIGQSTASDIC